MKKQNQFTPARMVFMAGGEVADEAEKKAPLPNVVADTFEANAEGKPPVDLQKKVPGYPDESPEITDKNSDQYKKIRDQLLPKLKEQLKRLNRDPRHGDAVGGTIDGHACFLVIDENVNPNERVFVRTEKSDQAGQHETATAIPEEAIKEKTEGFPEMKPAPTSIVKRGQDTFKQQQGRDMKNEETAIVFDEKDYKYYVLRDETNNKYRVFKSPSPVPA